MERSTRVLRQRSRRGATRAGHQRHSCLGRRACRSHPKRPEACTSRITRMRKSHNKLLYGPVTVRNDSEFARRESRVCHEATEPIIGATIAPLVRESCVVHIGRQRSCASPNNKLPPSGSSCPPRGRGHPVTPPKERDVIGPIPASPPDALVKTTRRTGRSRNLRVGLCPASTACTGACRPSQWEG